ncbi:hypothetical protein QWZ13_02205 [Reinekea marina]|nr:hypothetical protein [Reinekea marina]MDN3647720.1 hypothetical protein [Reinekea marina]
MTGVSSELGSRERAGFGQPTNDRNNLILFELPPYFESLII